MLDKFFIYCCLLILADPIFGQKSFQPKQVDFNWRGIVYRNETTGLATIHTNGYTIGYNKGQIKTYYKTKYVHFELGYMTDPREQKQNRNIPRTFNKVAESFKFGKQNYVYTLKAGKGVKRLISDKSKQRGVALGYNYQIGPALAILRPYYLDLVYTIERDDQIFYELRSEKYSSENADKFLDYNAVFGRSTDGKGWSELSIVPGVQGKLGLFYSIGAFEEYAKSVEIGVMAELYIRKMPIMVETGNVSNKPYFLNFYATAEFGKRTN
jgi:hypothetical protein